MASENNRASRPREQGVNLTAPTPGLGSLWQDFLEWVRV